jgi:hypothetical protein
MRYRSLVLAYAALSLAAPRILAQERNKFEDLFSSYAGVNGPGYLRPLAQVLGAGLNTGFVGPARIGKGFHFRLTLQTMTSFISEGQKTFTGTTEGNFTPQQTAEAPTIVGPDQPVIVDGTAGTGYVFPAGLAISRITFGVPQITVGGIAGTDVTFRWLGFSADEIGTFSMFGIGARHSISQYLENLPVDLAAGALYHRLKLTEVARMNNLMIGVQAGKDVGMLELYGGLNYETSTLKMDYENSREPGGRSQYDVKGASGVRLTAGTAINLKILKIHADVNLGTQTIVGLGLSFGN